VKVLIVDDQRVVREGLATIVGAFPDIEVVGLAEDGFQALDLAASTGPDVVLMDLRMPRMDGVEATKSLKAQHPDISVVILTTFADDDSIITALSAGAAGYLTKDATRDDIRRALEAAMAGQSMLPFLVLSVIGAVLGDFLSFWFGGRFSSRLRQVWPFNRRPDLMANAHLFFHRYGVLSVALCRFVPVLRSTVPLVAGMAGMPRRRSCGRPAAPSHLAAGYPPAFLGCPTLVPSASTGLSTACAH